jgi:hypothetical protein
VLPTFLFSSVIIYNRIIPDDRQNPKIEFPYAKFQNDSNLYYNDITYSQHIHNFTNHFIKS